MIWLIWICGGWMCEIPFLGDLLFGAAEPLDPVDTTPAYLR